METTIIDMATRERTTVPSRGPQINVSLVEQLAMLLGLAQQGILTGFAGAGRTINGDDLHVLHDTFEFPMSMAESLALLQTGYLRLAREDEARRFAVNQGGDDGA